MNVFSTHVPHAAALEEGEGPCNFVAGWNMPGYLPEMEPAFFEHFDDAKRFILDTLADEEEQLAMNDDDDEADKLSGLQQDLNLESASFTVNYGLYVYWVEST